MFSSSGPRFSGKDPKAWISAVERTLFTCKIHPAYHVQFALELLDGAALTWARPRELLLLNRGWNDFVYRLLCEFDQPYREDWYGDSSVHQENVIGELNMMVQTSTVQEYQERFERVQHLVAARYPHIDESYYVSCCINGLKDEIRSTVVSWCPVSVEAVFGIAHLKEYLLSTAQVISVDKDNETGLIQESMSIGDISPEEELYECHKTIDTPLTFLETLPAPKIEDFNTENSKVLDVDQVEDSNLEAADDISNAEDVEVFANALTTEEIAYKVFVNANLEAVAVVECTAEIVQVRDVDQVGSSLLLESDIVLPVRQSASKEGFVAEVPVPIARYFYNEYSNNIRSLRIYHCRDFPVWCVGMRYPPNNISARRDEYRDLNDTASSALHNFSFSSIDFSAVNAWIHRELWDWTYSVGGHTRLFVAGDNGKQGLLGYVFEPGGQCANTVFQFCVGIITYIVHGYVHEGTDQHTPTHPVLHNTRRMLSMHSLNRLLPVKNKLIYILYCWETITVLDDSDSVLNEFSYSGICSIVSNQSTIGYLQMFKSSTQKLSLNYFFGTTSESVHLGWMKVTGDNALLTGVDQDLISRQCPFGPRNNMVVLQVSIDMGSVTQSMLPWNDTEFCEEAGEMPKAVLACVINNFKGLSLKQSSLDHGPWGDLQNIELHFLLVADCYRSVIEVSTGGGSISWFGNREYGSLLGGFLWHIAWLLSNPGIPPRVISLDDLGIARPACFCGIMEQLVRLIFQVVISFGYTWNLCAWLSTRIMAAMFAASENGHNSEKLTWLVSKELFLDNVALYHQYVCDCPVPDVICKWENQLGFFIEPWAVRPEQASLYSSRFNQEVQGVTSQFHFLQTATESHVVDASVAFSNTDHFHLMQQLELVVNYVWYHVFVVVLWLIAWSLKLLVWPSTTAGVTLWQYSMAAVVGKYFTRGIWFDSCHSPSMAGEIEGTEYTHLARAHQQIVSPEMIGTIAAAYVHYTIFTDIIVSQKSVSIALSLQMSVSGSHSISEELGHPSLQIVLGHDKATEGLSIDKDTYIHTGHQPIRARLCPSSLSVQYWQMSGNYPFQILRLVWVIVTGCVNSVVSGLELPTDPSLWIFALDLVKSKIRLSKMKASGIVKQRGWGVWAAGLLLLLLLFISRPSTAGLLCSNYPNLESATWSYTIQLVVLSKYTYASSSRLKGLYTIGEAGNYLRCYCRMWVGTGTLAAFLWHIVWMFLNGGSLLLFFAVLLGISLLYQATKIFLS